MVLGRLRDVEAHALSLELVADAAEHQVHDQPDLLDGQRPEDDGGIDPVEELGPEGRLELLLDLLLDELVRGGLALFVGLALDAEAQG